MGPYVGSFRGAIGPLRPTCGDVSSFEEQNYDPMIPYLAPFIEEAKFQLQEEQDGNLSQACAACSTCVGSLFS